MSKADSMDTQWQAAAQGMLLRCCIPKVKGLAPMVFFSGAQLMLSSSITPLPFSVPIAPFPSTVHHIE